MAKAVFRANEITLSGSRIVLAPPTSFEELAYLAPREDPVEAVEPVELYTGPTAEDLKREAEAFKSQWALEREALIESANTEAERIITEAREKAAAEMDLKIREGEDLKNAAAAEAERMTAEAGERIQKLEAESHLTLEDEKREALEEGRKAGYEEGYAQGKAEVERLVQRTQAVLERAQDKRGEILTEAEQEIVDLVLLLTRKVVKTITESQRNVILQNVIQALRKVRARGNVIIRVNIADLKLTTEHTRDFIQMMEGTGIQVVEDSTVGPGGCVIETDFGEIDARISSQLAEMEAKILEMSPIKTKPKSSSSARTKAAAPGAAGSPAAEGV
ncbi:MAG: flagellar assembly protein FliH [Treponema sp.]|nr:flagellar assembly protein FliH [Treponema sp.]